MRASLVATDINQMDSLDFLKNKASRLMEDVVIDIAKDQLHFYAFAYELRKADADNKYTRELLEGQVQPSALVDLILANEWDGNQFKSNRLYRLHIGEEQLTLQSNERSVPFVSKSTNVDKTDSVKFILSPNGFLISMHDKTQGEVYL